MDAIAPAMTERSIIVPLLNGVRHIDILTERFGRGRVLGGLTIINAALMPDGTIQQSQLRINITMIGELDGQRCVIDWKTTTSRYPEDPNGLLSLDPQLICYSWIAGIPEVAFVVFVRKHLPEIQYLKATISEEKRREFGRLVETTVAQIESGEFPAHSGIRFPQNACVSCAHLGLCLNNQQLIAANLIRKPGASSLDWLDELMD